MIVSWLAGGAQVSIEFDATMREDHHGTTAVTQYNVERGVNVSDHARPNLDTITFDCIVTNTPIKVPRTNMQGVTGGFHPVEITTPTIPNFPRVLPGVGLITSFLPPGSQTTKVNVLEFDGAVDRIRAVYDELQLLQQSATVVRLATRLRDFEEMVITSLSSPRGPADGESITFSMQAQQIRFVDSEVVAVKADEHKKKTKGVKSAKPTDPHDSESVLHNDKERVKKFIGIR